MTPICFLMMKQKTKVMKKTRTTTTKIQTKRKKEIG